MISNPLASLTANKKAGGENKQTNKKTNEQVAPIS
jgi:hypothetical protein